MAFKPHVPKGTIWLVWGEDKDSLFRDIYTGKRTDRALRTQLTRARKGGNYHSGAPDRYFAYLQYEGPDFELQDVTPAELKMMGVIFQNITAKNLEKLQSKTGGGWSSS